MFTLYIPTRDEVKARNQVLRATFADRWPGVRFKVTSGYEGGGKVVWVDGPTEGQVHDCLPALSIHPRMVSRVQVERTTTVRVRTAGYLRLYDAGRLIVNESYGDPGRWRHAGHTGVDATAISADEDTRIAAVAQLAGADLADTDDFHRPWLRVPPVIEQLIAVIDAGLLVNVTD